jgi:ketosteroid isomerase-like protein
MSRELPRAMFRAIDARDWEALGTLLHPDLRYDRPGFAPLVGKDEVLRFYREVRSIHGEHRLETVVSDGDHGACWGRFVGAKADGTPLDLQFADCYGFKDGQLHRRKSFFFVAQV